MSGTVARGLLILIALHLLQRTVSHRFCMSHSFGSCICTLYDADFCIQRVFGGVLWSTVHTLLHKHINQQLAKAGIVFAHMRMNPMEGRTFMNHKRRRWTYLGRQHWFS